MFVGDVTTQILHNLEPGTTYDVKVFAQYDAGMSGPLVGQGTTCMYTLQHINMTLKLRNFYGNILTYWLSNFSCLPVYMNVTDLTTYDVGYDSFCLRWSPHRAATSYRIKINPFDREFNILENCQSFGKFYIFLFVSI